MLINERRLSKNELSKREEILKSMKKNKRKLVKKYGAEAEKVMYGRATNIAKKVAENDMENINPKLKEAIKSALMNEKKKSFPDLTKADILKARGVELKETNLYSGEEWSIEPEGRFWIVAYRTMDGIKEKVFQSEDEAKEFTKTLNEDLDLDQDNVLGDLISDMLKMGKSEDEIIQILKQKITSYFADPNLNEDLDLGHEDNEPHMVKADLYKIGKYAMELYQIVDQFEGQGEVDFPAWWQSKITNAASMISSAKHYLEFELKEPQIDAMVDVAAKEEAIGENMIDDISYRNSNNIMRGIYDLAKKSKDVESFKDKWYEIYSRGPQDKDADTDEWLEKTYTRVMSRVTTEEMTPEESRKKGMPFKNVTEEAIDEMSKKQIKKRGEIFDALVDKGMSKKKAGPIATSTAMKEAKAKIKEAILAKLKNK